MSFKLFQAFLHHERSWTVRVTVLVLALVALLCGTTILLLCALAGHESSLAVVTTLLDTGTTGLTLFIVLAVGVTLACMGLLAWVIGAVLRHEEQRDAEQGQMELLLEAMEDRVVQKNNELKELSRRALLLLDATNSGIMAVDRDGRITYANAMALTLTGHDKDEVLGNVLHDILHSTDTNTAPLSREHCPVCQAIREATETRFELLRLCRKDGSALLVNGAVSPLREDDELTGAVVIFHDVGTPRQTELWRRTFFKHTGESILVWDGRHRLVDANIAFCNMVGFGSLADVQEHFASLHAAKQPCGLPWRQALHYLFSCCERDGSVLSRWIFRHRDGREIPCEGHIVYMTGPLGVCYFTIMHDISHNLAYEAHLKQNIAEINELRVAAEASAVAKGEFLARMSHEIRTPMNAIIGMSHLLLATRLDAQQQHYLGSIRHAATNLLGILNDILDISKIEGGHLELEAAPFALREHVGNTLALFALMAQKKNIELLCYIQPDVPDMLVGDRLRLTQILGNLLNNAIKFTERGSVRLDIFLAQREGQTVTLRCMVQDTGVGMTEEQLGKLFQPFQQADASISRRYGGTGLGLAITRSLVERMGGTIEARSESGQGSAFVFDVKLSLDKAAPASDWHKSFDEVRSLLRGQRVLVDSPLPEFARMVRAMLGDLGLPCECVSNTADGIALAREAGNGPHPFGITILDADYARAQASSALVVQQMGDACLPTVIVTPVFSREHYDHAREWPALASLGLLTKPFDQVALGNALAQTLGLRDGSQKDRPSLPLAFAKTALAGARVLLVEDNDINQEVALALLEDVGIVAKLARDGAEAVELCREQAFDLVLMDIRMPVMDGIEATSTIRGLPVPWAATMPILALTADAMNEERERALASGMDDYITKPIEPEILFAKMGAWLGNASHE